MVDNHAMKDRYGRVPGQQCVPVDESVVIEDDIRTSGGYDNVCDIPVSVCSDEVGVSSIRSKKWAKKRPLRYSTVYIKDP